MHWKIAERIAQCIFEGISTDIATYAMAKAEDYWYADILLNPEEEDGRYIIEAIKIYNKEIHVCEVMHSDPTYYDEYHVIKLANPYYIEEIRKILFSLFAGLSDVGDLVPLEFGPSGIRKKIQ